MLRVGGVAIDAPADGAVAESDAAQIMDGAGEFGIVFGRDAVVDGDADGAGEVESSAGSESMVGKGMGWGAGRFHW